MAAQHEYPRVIPNTAAAQLKAAVRAERAAVVAWLRERAGCIRVASDGVGDDTARIMLCSMARSADGFADAIERGEHVGVK